MSATQDPEQVPATKEQWEELAAAAGLNNKCLSDCESLRMDSPVTYEHFLLFRTVISKKGPAEFDPASFGLKEKHDIAKQLLQASNDFQSYINAIKMNTFDDQGAFSGLRKSQKEAIEGSAHSEDKLERKDEQKRLPKNPLTEMFGAFDGKTLGFTATTHGQLQDEKTHQIRAIVDTSAEAPNLQIDIREASQIVAWVKEFPDPKYQRILVAQHACEFYVTFAVYDDDWRADLDRSLPESKSVMTVHRFGPWALENSRDVEEVSAIFLAISM